MKVSAYLADNPSLTGGETLLAAIYADNSGVPGALKAQSSTITVTDGQPAGWVEFAINPGVTLPAGNYRLVLQRGTPNNGARRYGDGAAGGWNRQHESGRLQVGEQVHPLGAGHLHQGQRLPRRQRERHRRPDAPRGNLRRQLGHSAGSERRRAPPSRSPTAKQRAGSTSSSLPA
jgi:hypothetical protein